MSRPLQDARLAVLMLNGMDAAGPGPTWVSDRIGILADLYVAPGSPPHKNRQAIPHACRDDCRALTRAP
jgi:hypothetical protein